MRTPLALALIGAIVVGGCGAPGEVIPVRPLEATVEDLLGPWRPTPLVLDGEWRERIERTCRRDVEAGPGAVPGVIDVRGGGVATVRLTGPSTAKCDALQLTRTDVLGAGGGMSGGRDGFLEPPAGKLRSIETGYIVGGELTINGWSVTGRVGGGVVRVEVLTTMHPPVTATLENGWFSAWWPARPGDRRPEQGVPLPHKVNAYGADGALLDETCRPLACGTP